MSDFRKQFEDKKTWGPGPWQEEPDRHEWRYKGLPCLLRRSPMSGGWCGYVAVPPGHPWHGRSWRDEDGGPDVEVHGGITFSQGCTEGGEICHVPEPGEPDDVWWLGFDCGHAFDVAPKFMAEGRAFGMSPLLSESFGTYRTFQYAKSETESLAEQALAAVKP
jgi:hypothetical protein